MEMQKHDDYNTLVFEKRMQQYKNSPRLSSIIETANDQANDLETAIFEVRDLFYLPTAEGVQLDIIGYIFNTFRQPGESDTDLRTRIQISASSRFSGTPEEIITAIIVIFGGTYANYIPLYPAGFFIATDAILTNEQIEKLAPAGVGVGELNYLVDANNVNIADANAQDIYAILQ